MASRPLGAAPGNISARYPVGQNVTLRWSNAVAPASSVFKTAPTPAKCWPPPPQVQSSSHAPIIATSTPSPVKNKSVSVEFQSARAVFEAKNVAGAGGKAFPSQPVRRRLESPAPLIPVAMKQLSISSDLSSSSCSTMDIESDQNLEENVEAHYTLEVPSLAEPNDVKIMEKEPVVSPRPVDTKAQAELVQRLPVSTRQVSPSHSPMLMATKSQQDDSVNTNPFRLLVPVEAVPTIPDEVACVYDNAAIEMEKNIKKVVRKLLRKNKARQEDFKVNSRLFGSDSMDSDAYLDTLIQSFGAIRALQLVPCLVSVQPNVNKRNALLLTAKNYRLQNEETLETELQALSARESSQADGVSTAHIALAVLEEVATARTLSLARSALTTQSAASQPKKEVNTPISMTACVPAAERIDTTPTAEMNSLVSIPAPKIVHAGADFLVQKESELIEPARATVIRSEEPMPEPHDILHVDGTTSPVINVEVAVPTPMVQDIDNVKARADPYTSIDSEDECAENLFGKVLRSAVHKKPQQEHDRLDVPVAATSPLSSSPHSFDEAESLFGERLPTSFRSIRSRRKTVTWGETTTAVERVSPVKKKPAPLIFGLATAGAFDSDSDDSEFSN